MHHLARESLLIPSMHSLCLQLTWIRAREPARTTVRDLSGRDPRVSAMPLAAGDPALWTTFFFVSTTLGLEVPVLSSLPRRNNSPLGKCGCNKHCMDFHSNHTASCTAHSGATKAHDWMVSVLGPLFRTAGHTVRTQHAVTASAGQRRGDVDIRNYLRDQAGSRRSSTCPSRTNGLAQVVTCSRTVSYSSSKKNSYRQPYADNQSISFSPP